MTYVPIDCVRAAAGSADLLTKGLATELLALRTLRPADEWYEEMGMVIWWHFPIEEPPYIGSGPGAGECDQFGDPTDCARLIEEGWLTHWSPIPWNPEERQ